MTRRRRPAAVTILAIIQLASALAYGLLLAALLIDNAAISDALVGVGGAVNGTVLSIETAGLRIVVAGFFVASLAGGVLLLRMRQLGWTIAMLLTGVGLASSVFAWLTQGTVVSIWLALQVVTVFYLNQREVRQAFGISRSRAAPEASRG
jgi:hypothetical protein